jgi:LPXTG-site transpeptidase (sortase) family protein
MSGPKNPLFPNASEPEPNPGDGYMMSNKGKTIQPLSNNEKAAISANPAADLIRQKLERLYANEPDPFAEEREAEIVRHRTKHQEFMHQLSTSGKGLAEIQTEWHNYYVSLPDNEKHQVWQEFYENNQTQPQPAERPSIPTDKAREVLTNPSRGPVVGDYATQSLPDKRPPGIIRQHIRRQVAKQADKMSPNARQNIKSLLFGLSTGAIVLIIFLFGFFNEVIIAPFIQPGRAGATPIIVNSDSVDASTPSIIIPKINVQIPVVYNVASNDENVIENALESGVVHYPTTVKPGEKGNAAFFGHSSNNIFNKGKYKFAFVLLHKLQKGDTFYLTYNNKVYGYTVIDRKIVDPSEVGVLNDVPGETATATLITCDPPGTSLHRLVVVGRQVTPDPTANTAAANAGSTTQTSTTQLPGNGPTLWTRLWRSVF